MKIIPTSIHLVLVVVDWQFNVLLYWEVHLCIQWMWLRFDVGWGCLRSICQTYFLYFCHSLICLLVLYLLIPNITYFLFNWTLPFCFSIYSFLSVLYKLFRFPNIVTSSSNYLNSLYFIMEFFICSKSCNSISIQKENI